jgi:choice-of-anchor C domain-containing protein
MFPRFSGSDRSRLMGEPDYSMHRGGLLLSIALLVATGTATAGSLLVNGGFEDGPAPATFLNLAGGDTSLKGWMITGEGIDIVAAGYWTPAGGEHSLDLDGSRRSRTTPPFVQGGVAQSFTTTPGHCYRVEFDMAGNPVKPPPVKPMQVSAAGLSATFTFETAGKGVRNMGWLHESWIFTADNATATLEFRSLTESPLTGYGPAIDNVSVMAIDCPSALAVSEDETEIRIEVGAEVLFDSGKYAIKPAAVAALQELAELLQRYPDLPVLIEGHTDSAGKPAANQVLSEQRADAVKQWLAANGDIPGDRMLTKGHGQTQPVASNATAEGRQQNRRVGIRVTKTKP